MKTCAACGQANPEGAKFCIECGVAQAGRCPGCGTPAPTGQKFCAECGQALGVVAAAAPPPPAAPATPAAGERKQVTVLFADVVKSMDLAEQLGADELSEVMSGLFDVCRDAVESFGGTIDKFTGDGVMALFGAPVAQEDHAGRACHAALRLVETADAYALTLRQHNVELAVRVGLNSGEVVAGSVGGAGGAFTAVALSMARQHGSGLLDEATLLANLARAQLALRHPNEARAAADEAVAVARRQGAKVSECRAQLVCARIWRETAAGDADLAEARAAVATGEALDAETGAATYAAFLTEERALLEPEPADQLAGTLAANAYPAIGATGHARRLHAATTATPGCG